LLKKTGLDRTTQGEVDRPRALLDSREVDLLHGGAEKKKTNSSRVRFIFQKVLK